MMFAMLNISVTDNTKVPVKLDNYYTLRMSTQDTIRAQNSGLENQYTVLDDGYVGKLQNKTDSFRFIGIKDGKQVVNELFILKADCCHIGKVSGNTDIIIK